MRQYSIPLAQNVAGLFMIAPPGAGKSSTFRCITHLFRTGEMWFGDTSDALTEAKADPNHPLRDELVKADADRRANKLVTGEVVIPVGAMWAEKKILENRRIRIFGWSGWPRVPEQIPTVQQFGSYAVLCLDVPPELAEARCLKRFRETPVSERRPDDPQSEAEVIHAFRTKRYPAFVENIELILRVLGDRVIRVDGTRSMVDQVRYILDQLYQLRDNPEDRTSPVFLPKDMHISAMECLADGAHPFYDEAAKSSNPGPRPAPRSVMRTAQVPVLV